MSLGRLIALTIGLMASAFLGLLIGIGTQALSSAVQAKLIIVVHLPIVGYITQDSIGPFVVPGLLFLSIYITKRSRAVELKQRVRN